MENKEYVLFSPVGWHDPMGNGHDGAMLHICRVYKPKKVYIVFSQDMIDAKTYDKENHNYTSDDEYNRYIYCLNKLNSELGTNIEYESLDEPGLENVHLFDEFQDSFTEYLKRIHQNHPSSELLVNISSGTPAMKSCLLFLSKMLPFHITAVQVDNPNKVQNKESNDYDYYKEENLKLDLKELWPQNKDIGITLNIGDDSNITRCREENYTNTLAQITKESICRHIDNYDYDAAIRESEQITEFLSDKAIKLLEAASQRVKINPSAILSILSSEETKSIVPIQQEDTIALFEYLLWLNMKICRNDISDFVRGITPALYHLSFVYLKEKCGINLQLYTNNEGKLKRVKFQKYKKGKELLDKLDLKYPPEFKDGSYINSDICIYLISKYAQDIDARSSFAELREFEKKIRNPVSHDIVKIDVEWMKKLTDTEPKIIWNQFKYVAEKTFKITPSDWDCYDRMNDLIKNEIKLG